MILPRNTFSCASTTHAQLTKEEREACGIHDNTIRLSIGIEHVSDLVNDLDQAIARATGA